MNKNNICSKQSIKNVFIVLKIDKVDAWILTHIMVSSCIGILGDKDIFWTWKHQFVERQ